MVALASIWRLLHLAQQRVHLINGEFIVESNSRMASHGCEHVVLELPHGLYRAELFDFSYQIQHQFLDVLIAHVRRNFADLYRAGTVALDVEASGQQRLARVLHTLRIARGDLKFQRHQQSLSVELFLVPSPFFMPS